MAITDYNKVKKLDVDSVSGTPTVDKAVPIICVDGDDSTTGNGDIVIDFTNIADAQDIAVYDQNDNLLDYEIEELDTTNNTAVLWVYDSWVRDGTTQAQVAYGSNSANTDRQNVTGTWGNTGQNMDMVQHWQESPLSGTDSTSNNNDLTINGATSTTGEFDGGANFDGTDDNATGPNDIVNTSTWTATFWLNSDVADGADTYSWYIQQEESGTGDNVNSLWVSNEAFENAQFVFSDGDSDRFQLFDESLIRGQGWVLVTVTFDSGSVTAYVNGTQEGTASGATNWGTGSNPLYVASRYDDNLYYDGKMDELKLTEDVKSQDWAQAEYDASPKAGQIFFSQQAAETTAPTVSQTVNDSLSFQENESFILKATLADSIGFQENSPATLIDTLNDTVGFTENLQATLIDTLTDRLDFNENTATTLIDTVSDQLNFTEQTLFGAIGVTASDNLTFGESIDTQLQDTLSDQVQFQENLVSTIADTISDQVQFQENFQVAVKQKLQDDLDFSENLAATLATTLTDQLSLQDQITATILTDLDITQPTKAILTNLNKFVVMDSHTFKEDDLGDKVKATLEDSSGAIDVSGVKQVNLKVKDRAGTKQLDQKVDITDGTNGKVEYQWSSGDYPIENAGVYRAEFEIIDANDEKETVPNDGSVTIEVEEQIE